MVLKMEIRGILLFSSGKNIVDRDTFGLTTGFTATYHFPVKGKFDLSSIRAVVERPGLWTVSVNGTEIKPEAGKWWLDRSFGVFSIGSFLKTGDNMISLKTTPMKIHAEVEPIYILGDFSVQSGGKRLAYRRTCSALFHRKLENTRYAILFLGYFIQ